MSRRNVRPMCSTAAAPGLYHGHECGRIGCEKHTPFPGSDTWRRDRWRKMTPVEVAAFAEATGLTELCETCRAMKAVAS